MKKIILTVTTLLALSIGFHALAGKNLDDMTMEATHHKMKKGHKVNVELEKIVTDYMLKNGDITQTELDERKATRQANYAELKELKEAGDKTAIKAKVKEIKIQRKTLKKSMKEYVRDNEELKTLIRKSRKEAKEQHREKRKEYREKRKQEKEQEEG